jgi:hypothetical protein
MEIHDGGRKEVTGKYVSGTHDFRDWCCHLYSSCSSAMQILGASGQNFRNLGGRADFLRLFIWSRVSLLMRFRDGSDKGTTSHFV